jgi:hypothetical protein
VVFRGGDQLCGRRADSSGPGDRGQRGAAGEERERSFVFLERVLSFSFSFSSERASEREKLERLSRSFFSLLSLSFSLSLKNEWPPS